MWIEGIGEVVVMKKTSAMRRLMATTFWSTRKRSEAVGVDKSAPQISIGGFMWSGVA
jgi:hypothetical protein